MLIIIYALPLLALLLLVNYPSGETVILVLVSMAVAVITRIYDLFVLSFKDPSYRTDYVITPELMRKMYEEYTANKIAFNKKYIGSIFEVQSQCDFIGEQNGDHVIYGRVVRNCFPAMTFTFSKTKLASKCKGDYIVAKGQLNTDDPFSGGILGQIFGTPLVINIRHCVLVK